MDEDANALLREIRDATVRHEKSQRRRTGVAIALIAIILTILGFLTTRLEILLRDVGESDRPATPAASPEQAGLRNAPVTDTRLQKAAIANHAVREILAKDFDPLGEWDGDPLLCRGAGQRVPPEEAVRAHADIHIIQDPDFRSRGMFQVDFIVESRVRAVAVVRFANFKDGVLTLDEPIDVEWGVHSELPFSALLAVRTDRGEFLVPVSNAATMTTVDELKPGFAYKRASDAPIQK